jgi:hypothetical protein
MRSSSSTSLSWRHAGARTALRLELDGGLEHLQRRRVGGGLGAAGLAVDALHLGHGLDQAVGLLQQFGGLAGRQAGQRRRHVQQVAFVQRRHELAADVLQRPQAGHQHTAATTSVSFGKRSTRVQQRR